MRTATLRPEGPLSEWPRSDTLFGAICWGIRLADGEEALEDVLVQFLDDEPPFRISSAYPLLSPDNDRIHLLPRPRLPLQTVIGSNPDDETIEALKRFERLNFLPETVFQQLVTGKLTGPALLEAFATGPEQVTIDDTVYYITEEFLLPETATPEDENKKPPQPYVKSERVRNAVNRLTNATEGELFHDESIVVRDWAALSIAIEGDVELVLSGLAAIQDHGIGGGKSVGRGAFRLGELGEIELPSDESGPTCTLSLCIPREDSIEEVLTEGFYETETRKGVIESSFASEGDIWKRQVLALAEGSILPATDTDVGYNPVVADRFEHGVQQLGYELPVSVSPAILPEWFND